MGNKQTIQQNLNYSVEVSQSKQGETPIYRNPLSVQELAKYPKSGATNLQKIILDSVNKFGNRNCLGTRRGPKGEYEFKTYQQILDLSKQIGSGIINLNLIPEVKQCDDLKLKLVGIHVPNREEWITLDISNMIYGHTMVPLYDTLGPETIEYVINHSEITTLFCQSTTIKSMLSCKQTPYLKNVVIIGEFSDDIVQQVKQKGYNIYTWNQVLEAGKKSIQKLPEIPKSCCYTFSYTSGTTGYPKAVMVRHLNLLSALSTVDLMNPPVTEEDVHLSYLPLPHILERGSMVGYLYKGASIQFFNGDMLKLREDLADVRPTVFISVPRLFNKFYSGMTAKFQQATGVQKFLLDRALSSKLYYLETEGAVTHKLWDALVFNKTKALLGGRAKMMLSGSAPISNDIINFLKVTMCCQFKEGYGMTESIAAAFMTYENDIVTGHVGGPTIAIEVKLVDVPEMNYNSKDRDEQGRSQPRGEICLRGPSVFQGYYKDKQKTEESIDIEGWLHTGDIGVRLYNGAFKIVDRKKNIFKLAQGEYVAPEKVENIYGRAPVIEQVFLHGDSLENFCIGVIHPNQEAFMELAKKNNQNGTFEELCKNEVMKKAVLDIATQYGKSEKLFGFEQAKKVVLLHQSLQEYGCLTNTMKLQRHKAKLVFKDVLSKIYQKSK